MSSVVDPTGAPVANDPAPTIDAPPIDDTLAPPSVTETPETDDAEPSVEDKVAEIGKQYGLDTSGFSTEADAIAHVKHIANLQARNYFSPKQTQPQPQQPNPPAPEEPEFNWEDEDLDPKVAAGLKALKDRADKAVQTAEKMQEVLQQQEQQRVQGMVQVVEQRANAVIDGLQNPTLGTTGQRTVAQEIATNNVIQLAGEMIAGMQTRGEQVPQIETVMQRALLAAGYTGAPAQQIAPAPSASLAQRTPVGTPSTPNRPARAGSAGAGGTYMNDPEFMAGARAILRR